MGGEWFPWGQQGNSNPALFKKAFCNFANSFHAVSRKFKIVWDVTAGRGDVSRFYPGDNCADVVSQDFYWNVQWIGSNPVAAFNWLKDPSNFGLQWLANFAAQHNKPVAFSEWGVPNQNLGGPSVGKAACDTYLKLVRQWFDSHNTAYQTVWNSAAGGYPGTLSTGNSQCSAAYK